MTAVCGCAGIGRLASLRCLCPDGRTGSTPVSRTNRNDPTQFEQTVVSCSDWVGSFFACSPFASRVTGFFGSRCHVSLAKSKQYKIKVKNV